MAHLDRKYVEHFEKLIRDWESFKTHCDYKHREIIIKDLELLQKELRNCKF